MRKTKLLLVAFLAMLGLSVNAQSWTAASVEEGEFLLYNVGKGQFFTKGNGWGTQASMTAGADDAASQAAALKVELIAEGTYYLIRTGVNDPTFGLEHLNGGTMYTDQSRGKKSSWEFINVGTAEEPVYNIISKDNHGGGAGAYLTANADNTILDPGNDGTSDFAKWKLLLIQSKAEKLLAPYKIVKDAIVAIDDKIDLSAAESKAGSATTSAEIDEAISLARKAMTDYLKDKKDVEINITNVYVTNPSFETGNTTGWTYEGSDDHGAKENSNATYNISNADGKYVFNIWSSGNLISQTIEGLPMGSYKLKVLIATDANHQVQISANGKTKVIDAIGKETGVEGEVEFDVLDGKATIGAEGVDKYWYKVDNFRLIFVKAIDLAGLVANYEAALSEAQDIDQNAPMNNDVKSALTTALGKYSSVSKTDVDALTEATIALQNAADNAKACITAYADAQTKLAAMKQLTENTNVYTKNAYDEYYGQWVVKYDACTLTTAEANALQNPFAVTGWHASITCDNFLLSAWDTNPDFNNAAYYINTWSTEGNNDGSNFKVPFFEYWTEDANSLGEKTLTATMTADPGIYNVSAWVRVRAKNGYTAPAYGITMQANEGKAVNVAAGDQVGTSQFYLKEFTARGIVGEDGKLYIKFIVAADNNISWLSFQNVKFAKVEAEEVAVTDAEYATFVSDLSLDFTGKNIKAYTAKVSGDKIVLSQINKVAANTPVVLYAENGATENIPLLSGDADDATGNELIAGEATSDGTFYVLANKDKGVGFYKLNADQKVPAGKAYLKIAANTREFYGFGETTGIETVKTVKAENGIFNLQGQRLVKAQKGLNIINGKKAMVK